MSPDTTPPPSDTKPGAGSLSATTGKISAWIRYILGRASAVSNMPASLLAAPGEPPPRDMDDRFSSEMFVQLLLELPSHRCDIAESWRVGDLPRLRSSVHRLLGATVYCDAPQLEAALRELRSALHSGDAAGIALQHARALDVIDTTLNCSGCR
jgi:hypothetical protein